MESSLSVTRVELLRSQGRFLGAGRDPTAWNAIQRVDVNDTVDIGIRNAYHPPVLPGEANSHTWSFMEPVLARLTLNAPYSLGTVSVTAGVVTLTGGTWPAWAADGQLVVDGVAYTVATRNSGTQLTLDNTTVTAASGSTFTLTQVDIQLPDNFGGVVGELFFRDTNDVFLFGVQRVPMQEILRLRQEETFESEPVCYAIQPIDNSAGTGGQRWMMSFWPPQDEAEVLTFRYVINPNQLTANAPFPLGGMPFGELLRESCLAAAETEIKGEAGIHTQKFMQLLQAAVSFDRRMNNPGNLGYNGSGTSRWNNDRNQWIGDNRDWLRYTDTSPVGFA